MKIEHRRATDDGMQSRLTSMAAGLSDADLLRQVQLLAGREREATVELICHLAELDARKLHLVEGYGSLFAYCTAALRLAEHAAYNRIVAARVSRHFPAILDRLADGSLNLSTVRLLAPHLQSESFEELVALASGRSKREVEALVASLAPRPDVTSSVRKLPARTQGTSAPRACEPVVKGSLSREPGTGALVPDPPPPDHAAPLSSPLAAEPGAGATPSALSPGVSGAGASATIASAVGASRTPSRRPLIAPLAPERYQVRFTIGEATHEKLRRVQELLRREIPDGDPGAIFDRALTLLLEDVSRKKLALTSRPRAAGPRPARPRDGLGVGAGVGARSRHIPAHVKRAVWLRDGGRCAFVGRNGRRCSEHVFLEFHHREPYAIGGETTVDNVSLACRGHNAYEAELVFGPGMAARARGSRVLDHLMRGS